MTDEELGRAMRVILRRCGESLTVDVRLKAAIGREPLAHRWIATVGNYTGEGPTPDVAIESLSRAMRLPLVERHGFSCYEERGEA